MALIAIAQVLKATGINDKTEDMVFKATEAWMFDHRSLGSLLDA